MSTIELIKQACEVYLSVKDEKARKFCLYLIKKYAGEL